MSRRRPRPLDQRTPDPELIAASHEGDAEAFDLLVDRYRRFVRSRSRGFFLMGGDREDLEQEALIGFYKAVRDFQPGLDRPFRAFAELCINRQLITAIKAANRKKHAPLNTSVPIGPLRHDDGGDGPEEDPALRCADPYSDPLDRIVAMESGAATRDLMARELSELEIEVVTRHLAGLSYEAIAEELGRHVKAVDNALQRVKRKLGDQIGGLATVG